MTIANTTLIFDGTNLMTLAYSVRSQGLEESAPPRKGGNLEIPGATGTTYLSKTYGERTINLALWLKATGTAGGAWSAAELGNNINRLTSLFGTDGTHTLTRTRGTQTLTSVVEVRDFRAIPGGPYHYDVNVSMVMCYPFWTSVTLTQVTIPFSAVPEVVTVNNTGTYRVEKAILTLTCGIGESITNPKFTIGSSWVQYTGTVSAGQVLTINCGNFTATKAGSSVISSITHSPSYYCWLSIPAGSSSLTITASGISNTPELVITFYPPYL